MRSEESKISKANHKQLLIHVAPFRSNPNTSKLLVDLVIVFSNRMTSRESSLPLHVSDRASASLKMYMYKITI